MESIESLKSDIISIINDRQQVTYNELQGLTSSLKVSEEFLKKGLEELEEASAIASRSSGGILTYYMLQDEQKGYLSIIMDELDRLMNLIGQILDVAKLSSGNVNLDLQHIVSQYAPAAP